MVGVLCLPQASAAALTTPEDPFVATMIQGLSTTPEARIEDAYKWLHQACFGAAHAAPSHEDARAWLTREWASLTSPSNGERLLESLRPDGGLVRLNLRPYKARGGSLDALVAAFVAGATRFRPDPATFQSAWRMLGRRLDQVPIGRLTAAEWQRLDESLRAQHYPAIHHSAEYVKAYAPAYRLLMRVDAEALTRRREPAFIVNGRIAVTHP